MSNVVKFRDGWHVVDDEGFDVSYVAYDTKREALDSLKVYRHDMTRHCPLCAAGERHLSCG